MAVELYNDGSHIVHAFYDLVDDTAGPVVQCNQFLVVETAMVPSSIRAAT